MKKLKDADISDGIKAYNLSRLINGGFNVPDGFIINESDIINLQSGNIDELSKYFSEIEHKSIFFVLRPSINTFESENKKYNKISESIMQIFRMNHALSVIVKYVIESAQEKHSEIIDNNKDVSVNFIFHCMIHNCILKGIAFSAAIDDNGSEVIRIEASESTSDKILPGSNSSSMINIQKSELYNDDVLIDVYGKSFDYSKMIDLAKETDRIEKYFKKPVIIEWCISNEGEIFIVQVDSV